MIRSVDELTTRIARSRAASERLDVIDYCGGRLWLAHYAADNDIIADALEELLRLQGEPIAFGQLHPDRLRERLRERLKARRTA